MQELETVFGGLIALLAKSARGAAVQTIAPAAARFTALDLKVNFLRPTRVEGEELIATGSVTHRGRKLSIANAVVTYRGRRIAIATGTTALLRRDPGHSAPCPPGRPQRVFPCTLTAAVRR